jgi:hypothetical protein
MTAHLKGTALRPTFDYIRQVYGEEVWTAIFERLPPEHRREINFLQTTNHYPVELPGSVLSAFVDVHCQGNRVLAEALLRDVGRHTADHMLDGIYSVFLRHRTLDKAFMSVGHAVETMYKGTSADIEHTPGDNHGVVHVHGLLHFTYVSPRLCGWAERSLERAGAKSARVSERSWRAGKNSSNQLTFEAAWE